MRVNDREFETANENERNIRSDRRCLEPSVESRERFNLCTNCTN